MNDFEKLSVQDFRLWRHAGEIVAAKYVAHQLKLRGFNATKAAEFMAAMPTTIVTEVHVPLRALIHKRRTLGFAVDTWSGEKCGTLAETRRYLRHEGYSVTEIAGLLHLARRSVVHRPDDVRRSIERGIRP